METKSTEFTGDEKPQGFLIVGIGASAGGIQALKEFFEQVPADSGMAYVVILHLSPDHDSKLAEILQVVAPIPVSQVLENTKIKPDHVYVVPPNQHLIIQDEFIAPSINMNIEDRRAPVDIFFRNLADVHGPRAVCVVLSGTGANGSMGLKRIKERGGVAYVQNPREAEFNEMPRNSIATDLVDEVLNVAEIPARIMAYQASLGSVQIAIEAERRPEPQQQALREIFTQLRVRTGHDFSNYKRPTLLRRIERRINVRNLPDLPSYTAFLHEHTDETQALLKDLLISVTNFFRDWKAFEALERDVLPAIFGGKTSEDQVRIWVAGCATGEEAYSIAMLCAERALGVIDAPKVQVFATDIDETAIATAREGFYTINDAADVSPDRLRRFFNRDGDGYRVRREIREMILFAHHNFLKDPPFSRLDMVTCRNVLIYLNNTAQERVMETFHFALKPRGFLFVGTSESVDGASDLYATFSRDYHIYQTREVQARTYPVPESVPHFHFQKNDPLQKPEGKEVRAQRISFGELHQKLLEQYAPPSVVINEEYEIVHMTDRVGKYFEFAGGEPTQNLLKLIRPEIRLELRSALYQAVQHHTAVEARNVKLLLNGQYVFLDIHIRPVLHDGDTAKGFILVIFNQNEEVPQEGGTVMVASDEPVARQLEEELTRLKAQLRSSVEQHEFQSEELKASNEELQAMNEELRSAAEELETSKEELQSMNEELRTVNQELKVKIDETSVISNNLQNLINSAEVGTIFLDRSFCIRLYTPAVLDLFNLKPTDYGRPFTDITHKLKYDSLLQDAETVLGKLAVVEREVTTSDNRHFMMRLLPYRTSEDRINGVVITFFDITKRKQSENALQQSEDRLRLLIESAKDYAILSLDTQRRVVSWSTGAEMMIGYSETEIVGKLGDVIFTPEDRVKNDPQNEAEMAASTGRAQNERWHQRKDGSRFWGSGSVSSLRDNEGALLGFVKIMRDLTVTRRLEEAKFFLASIIETSNDSVITIDFQRNITSWNKAAEHLYGYTAEEVVGKNLSLLTLPEDFMQILNNIDAIVHNREVTVFDTIRHNKNGELMQLEIVMSPVLNTTGDVIGISTIASDVSERKRREANLAFLAKINLDFAPLLSVHDVMEPIGERLANYLNLSRCEFSIVDEEADRIEVIYEYRRDETLPSLMGVHRISDNLTDEGWRHYSAGKVSIINATADNPLVKPPANMLKELGLVSLVDVPYVEGGQWKFLLTAARAEVGEWRSDEVEVLQELTSKIYIRIQRARAEEEMRKSEEKYRTLFETIDEGFCIQELLTDEAGNVTDIIYREVNKAYVQHSGITDAIDKKASELFPHLEQHWLDSMTHVYKTGEPVRTEGYHSDLDRWFTLQYSRIGGPGSRFISVVFNNITDRKNEEERKEYLLKLSDALKELTDPVEVQVTACKILGEHVKVNRVLYGEVIDEEQIIVNNNYVNGVPPINATLDAEQFGKNVIDAFKRNEKIIFSDINTESEYTEDEKRSFLSLNVVANVGIGLLKRGRWVATFGMHYNAPRKWTATEIWLLEETAERTWAAVERAKAEQALRKSEEIFRSFVSASSQVVYKISADWKQMEFLSGKQFLSDRETATDNWFINYIPVPEKERVAKAIEAAINSKQIFELEHRVHDSGNIAWVYSNAVPILNENGEIVEWIGAGTNITERKKVEEALSRSEARFRTLADVVPQVIWTNNGFGIADYFNQRWYEYTGLSYEQSEGLGWQAIVHPEDAPASVEKWNQALAAGKVFDTEYRLRNKKGGYCWFIGRNVPLKDESGKVIGWFGSATDVENLKKTEEALSQSEARLKITMESATDYAIITMDTSRRVERWSQGATQIFGYTEAEIKGALADAIFTEEDQKTGVPLEEMETARDTGRAADERWHLRKDGSRFYASGVMRPIENSELTGYVKVLRDVTEQKKAEEILRIMEERHRIALQSAEMAAWDWDVVKNEVTWNDQHFYLLGLKPSSQELDSGFMLQFVHEADKQHVAEELQAALNEKSVYHAEFRIRRADNGEVRWMTGYGKAVERVEGQGSRMVGVMYDSTERRAFTEDLSRLVSERTLELQRSNNDLQQFASIASHDLQEPLRKLKLFSSILQKFRKELPEEGKNILAKIHVTSDRMSQLIREVLQFSKIAYGVKEYVLTDLHQILQNVLSDLDMLLGETGTTVTYNGGLPQIEAAPSQMNQLFYNLLINAVKFRSRDSQSVITIFTQPVSKDELKNYPDLQGDKDYIEMVFSDNGIGFEQQYAEQIFQIFERLHTVEEYEGTGVGLALCKKIVENHSGHIFAISTVGKGATFHILLPEKQ